MGEPLGAAVAATAALSRHAGRTRHVGRLLRGDRAVRDLARSVHALYAALADVTGAVEIVDSSKGVAGAILLERMPIDYTVVHLMRDPVATIQSNAVESPDPSDPPRISGNRLVATSVAQAAAAQLLRRRGRLREVDLEAFLVEHDGVELGPSHQCEGNPSRRGSAVLRAGTTVGSPTADRRARAQAVAIRWLRRLG